MDNEYMTKEGYAKLVAKLKELEEQIREAGQAAGEAAGASCDWHDNPAYEQAQEEQRILSKQIQDLDLRIRNARFIEDISPAEQLDTVALGSTVVVEIEGDEETYFIGGSPDSNPSKGIISYKSPLAQTIMGCKAGDVREFRNLTNSFKVKILRVERKTDENG